MKRVKFIKYHPLFAYSVGDECELLAADADMLIKSKHAVSMDEQPEQETQTVPDLSTEASAKVDAETAESKEQKKSEKAVGKGQRKK